MRSISDRWRQTGGRHYAIPPLRGPPRYADTARRRGAHLRGGDGQIATGRGQDEACALSHRSVEGTPRRQRRPGGGQFNRALVLLQGVERLGTEVRAPGRNALAPAADARPVEHLVAAQRIARGRREADGRKDPGAMKTLVSGRIAAAAGYGDNRPGRSDPREVEISGWSPGQ